MRQHPSKQEASPVPFMAKIMTGRGKKEKNKINSALKPEISQHRSFGCEHSRERPCLITSKLPHSGPDPVPKQIVRHSPVFIFTMIKRVYIYIAWSRKVDHKQANKTHLSILCLWLRWCHSHHELSPETADTECQEIVWCPKRRLLGLAWAKASAIPELC